MKELDVKKIYSDNLTSVSEMAAHLTNIESKLLSAIIIMQFVIENPDDTEVNLRSMQKFVDQFTKS